MTVTNVDGTVAEAYVSAKSVPMDLHDMLARVGLESMSMKTVEGLIVQYSHWEYDCGQCGSYDHNDDECPNDDSDEEVDEVWTLG